MQSEVKIIECPRDAMQGMTEFIPTTVKAAYLNTLLEVGFDTIDFGSFVSPKAIPQLKDTTEVLSMLNLTGSRSKLLAIVANSRGGDDAVKFDEISYLGFPFSVSETFQQRNTNAGIEQALATIAYLQELCINNKKKLVVYLSMAFGNPYQDAWHPEIVIQWAEKISNNGVEIISLADTVGLAEPKDISSLFGDLIKELPQVEIGAHLHCKPNDWQQKVDAAFKSGCRRFDGAIKGYGGCPMAGDTLTGNLATELLIKYLDEQNVKLNINRIALSKALNSSTEIFN